MATCDDELAIASLSALDGHDITGSKPDQITRKGLVRTFQIARGLPRLSVLENLLLYGPGQPGEGLCQALLRTRASRAREPSGKAEDETGNFSNLTVQAPLPASA